MEEAAFISRIVPMKIARANEVGFIGQPLAAYGCGQGNERASARPSGIATPMADRARMFYHPEHRRAISPMMVDHTNFIGRS
jgi:hypothetical protein